MSSELKDPSIADISLASILFWYTGFVSTAQWTASPGVFLFPGHASVKEECHCQGRPGYFYIRQAWFQLLYNLHANGEAKFSEVITFCCYSLVLRRNR